VRALVTGSAGFVGRHFVAELLSRGYGLVTLDTAEADGQDCRYFFDSHVQGDPKFDLVVHCAAVIGGRMGIENNAAAVLTENLSLDSSAFRWALRARPRHFVYFSSSAVYGTDLQAAIWKRKLAESDMGREGGGDPDATYGFAKFAGEETALLGVRRGPISGLPVPLADRAGQAEGQPLRDLGRRDPGAGLDPR